jgi:hypothetical protein
MESRSKKKKEEEETDGRRKGVHGLPTFYNFLETPSVMFTSY